MQRVLRSVDDPNAVFIYLEFESLSDAEEARNRLVSSDVLDRFDDKHEANVLVDADNRRLRRCPHAGFLA
jgi:hypothetical protein